MAVANPESENPAVGSLSTAENMMQVPATRDGSGSLENVDESGSDNLILTRLRKLSRPRQIQLIMILAATISMIVALYLWTSEPNYQLLYGKLTEEAAGEIVLVLKQEGIDYHLDKSTGKLEVRGKDLHSTRIMLAAQGLPKSDGSGYEMLNKSQGFGSSQFMEKVRYHRAIEGELARSIAGFDAVESARVHLAIPKQSVFIRDKREPSAAVMVNLKSGRGLDDGQVMSIVHMVASSIPEMSTSKVTVVDQKGLLLSKKELSGDMAMSTAQFDYRIKLEAYYVERIERILIPLVGFEGVRAQVDTNIDFTVIEQTQESFNPDLPALRSEHTINEESRGGDPGSVPGALTNQPPGVANAPEILPDGKGAGSGPSRKSSQATFNYELDKTISHSRQAPGQLRRLSVAVVIDDKMDLDENQALVRTSYAPEEIEQITRLIKDAVGFSEARGDSINVVNAAFKGQLVLPEKPPGPFWERQWIIDLTTQVVVVLLILLFIVIAMRPIIRELTYKEPLPEETPSDEEGVLGLEEGDGELDEDEAERALVVDANGGLSDSQWDELGITFSEYEQMLADIKKMAVDDPRVISQVIKAWIALDEEGV